MCDEFPNWQQLIDRPTVSGNLYAACDDQQTRATTANITTPAQMGEQTVLSGAQAARVETAGSTDSQMNTNITGTFTQPPSQSLLSGNTMTQNSQTVGKQTPRGRPRARDQSRANGNRARSLSVRPKGITSQKKTQSTNQSGESNTHSDVGVKT